MTVYREERGTWRYQFQYASRRYSGRGHATKHAATSACEDKRREVVLGRTAAFPTFADLVEHFLAESLRTKTTEWVYQLQVKLNRIAAEWADYQPREISPAHVATALQRLRRKRAYQPRTVNEYRKILFAVFKYAVDLEALAKNPVKPIRRESETNEPRPIPTTELQKLLLAADPPLRRLLLLLALTGARWREIAWLRLEDVHTDVVPPYIVLRTRKTRGGGERQRKQYLTAAALDAVTEQMSSANGGYLFPGPRGGKYSANTANNHIRELRGRAGVGRYSYHNLRHWAGTAAVSTGVSNKVIARYLGHQHTSATERYMGVEDALMLRVAEHLSRELAPGAGLSGAGVGADSATDQRN